MHDWLIGGCRFDRRNATTHLHLPSRPTTNAPSPRANGTTPAEVASDGSLARTLGWASCTCRSLGDVLGLGRSDALELPQLLLAHGVQVDKPAWPLARCYIAHIPVHGLQDRSMQIQYRSRITIFDSPEWETEPRALPAAHACHVAICHSVSGAGPLTRAWWADFQAVSRQPWGSRSSSSYPRRPAAPRHSDILEPCIPRPAGPMSPHAVKHNRR